MSAAADALPVGARFNDETPIPTARRMVGA